MYSTRILSQRLWYVAAAFVMVLALVLPSLAFAAQVTERSVALSTSSAGASNVTYQVNFTSANPAEAVVIDFCSNSPLIGQECTAPAGFNASAAEALDPGFMDGDVIASSANRVVIGQAIESISEVSIPLGNITNPTAAGALYARIVTFDSEANATASSPTALGSGVVDEGGVAIAITPTIGVSGTVLESLTFCVSAVEIIDNCVTTEPPVVELGEQVGDVVALTPGVLSDGSIHTQISTNAASGAVIRLKSNAVDCGGLIRSSDREACDILPALNTGIDANANEAKFGVMTADATDTEGENVNPSGTLRPAAGSFYSNSAYALNFVEGNQTGITSTFGDPFLDTAGEPVNAQNMELTFGVTVNNNTPAGTYSADLSLIAVGKF